ncbi:hypothetical protein VCRA2114E365_20452 [Vibrio crassostreae]|nr:hypothetical protein VCRA2117O328_110133 [Vibrio crassostreae]CAK1789326.1 hypothetical protein VCRA2119O381_140044 [Vibrio crassostreae]CAK1831429.1 hypothetical protein VCRA2113O356_10059 [Vibrio crassostreae]CAK1855990.1 hypothetical protein VCRA2113O351_10350 [Vibrio crassostreae]CAK1867911.1 hypothetical protein VCRA2117O378_10430 [Vibrio crassostreae]
MVVTLTRTVCASLKNKKLIPYALNYNLQNSSGPSYCVHFFASNIDLLSIFAAKTTC